MYFVALPTNDYQQTRSNLDDMTHVATVAGEFVVTLAVACAGDEVKPSRPFQHALDELQKWVHLRFSYPPLSSIYNHCSKLHDIAEKCNELSHHNVLWRFFQQGVDQGGLSAMKQDLHNAVVQFQVCSFVEALAVLYLKYLRQKHNFSNILTCSLWVKSSMEN